MNNHLEYFVQYHEGVLNEKERLQFENKLLSDDEFLKEYLTYKYINDHLQSMFDAEKSGNSDDSQGVEMKWQALVSALNSDSSDTEELLSFLRDSFPLSYPQEHSIDEISSDIPEISEINLNEVVKAWVKEWHDKGKANSIFSHEIQKIKSFIRGSMPLNEKESIHRMGGALKHRSKAFILVVGGIAAAVFAVGFILIHINFTRSNPEELFLSYYEPLTVINTVMRSTDSNAVEGYQRAIELYQQGHYNQAAEKFSEIYLENDCYISARFFDGISRIELAQYDTAISLLYEVASQPCEYITDAQWYLALLYLRTGKTESAIPYLEELSRSHGYYAERVGKIIRRL
jgi:tetratricopeptide (TPR) repeat protein